MTMILASAGCASLHGREPELEQDTWASATVTTLTQGLVIHEGASTLFVEPADGSDIYVSALAVQALARAGALTEQDWRAFARRVGRVTTEDGLRQSVAGPVSTALELMTAAQISGRTLISRSFENTLRATAPSEPGGAFDLYDGIAGLALSPDRSDGSALRAAVRRSLTSLVQRNGCSATETLFALGAAANVHERINECSEDEVRSLVNSQIGRAAIDLRSHQEQAGLPHAEVLLAAARLAGAGIEADVRAVAMVGKTLLENLARSRKLGAAAAAGVTAQAFATVDLPMRLDGRLVDLLRETVFAGGEPQAIELNPAARALLARTIVLLGDSPPPRLLVDSAGLDVADRVELMMATGATPGDAVIGELAGALTSRPAYGAGRGRESATTVLLRAVNLRGDSTCSSAGVRQVVGREHSSAETQPLDRALRLRWNRLCGRPDPDAETRLLRTASNQSSIHRGGSADLLHAWQLGAVRCALAPRRLDPKAAWRRFGHIATVRGGVSGTDGQALDLTSTFALVALTVDPSRACHRGTFG